MQDLQGGRIDYLCDIIATAKPQIDGGAVKGVAIMTKERSAVLPDLPTTGEQGVDVQAYTWNAIFLPKGTPDAIVKKLHDTAVEAMKSPQVRDKLEPLGVTIVSEDRMSTAYLDQFVKDEIAKWGKAIAESGAQTD